MITAISILMWIMSAFFFGVFARHDPETPNDKSGFILWAVVTLICAFVAASLQIYGMWSW